MTGFGSASGGGGEAAVTVEVRSVNGRHLRLDLRLPPGGEPWEPGLRELVASRAERGSVDLTVRVEETEGGALPLELDRDRVEAYLRAFATLREEYSLPGRVDLPLVVQAGGLLRPRPSPGAEAVSWEDVEPVAAAALDELVAMRDREGERLEADLRERLAALERGIDRVEELAPRRLERERSRLLEAVGELTGGSAGDEERVAREIAVLADRWDVGEELVRARAHLEAFDELLAEPAGTPVGKRLGFLVQELHREVNTTGAKANDAEISGVVVEMKNEIERLREQIENVE
ncbi:MAG TPA: YicC/YloC family endoribonuclease [Gemmatimonadota bacterium]|nr:YicC/YloC family endoribonuclease [Gemmatimonadota bacterium]